MKKNILKTFLTVAIAAATLQVFADETITIATSPVPHADILKYIKPILKKDGVNLEIKEFSDYVQPNLLVEQKQLDANYFQHIPYLEQFNKEHSTHLVSLVGVQIEPMGLYANSSVKSQKFAKSKSFKDLVVGSTIAVPNDTTNEGRALLLLQNNKLIKIKEGIKYPTKRDIISNPYNLNFKELEAGMLPRILLVNQVDFAVINSNYALVAKLNPIKDSIYIEGSKSPYVNIVAIRPDDLQKPKMKLLAKVLNSENVKKFINNSYKGAVVAAF